MKGNITGKTVLVTGAGSGLGREIALDLASAGLNVIIHYHSSKEGALSLLEDVKNFGVYGWMIKTDLSRQGAQRELISKALEQSRGIDFLINSAAVYRETTLNTLQEEDITEAVHLNAVTPLLLSRSFRSMCKQGAVINILDARMVDYDRNHVAYSLSKQMLFSLTRMMSVEFAPEIRVNAVAPGIIIPKKGTTEATLQKMREAALLKKTGTPGEVCSAVRYLLSSTYVTGETIFVDGGRNVRGKMFGL